MIWILAYLIASTALGCLVGKLLHEDEYDREAERREMRRQRRGTM